MTTLTPVTIAPGRWLDAPAAASYTRMRALGMPDGGITSAGRTYAEQQALWERQGHLGLASRPGSPNSRHEQGRALDLSSTSAAHAWLVRNGPRHGWTRPLSFEPWHFEYDLNRDQHRHTPEDDMPPFRDWPQADKDALAQHVWAYKTTHDTRDAWAILRAAETGVRGLPRAVAAAVWSFKRTADKVRGADRIDVVQMLADVLTKVTGKAPDTIKHPAQRTGPTDF